MDFIYELLDLSATGCYIAIAALFVYHLVNCWQRGVPSPVPAIACSTQPEPVTPHPEPEIFPPASVAPEPTPIADVATTPTVRHRRQASPTKGFGNKASQKQQKKRQPVTV